jgi:hypothetical protein
MDEKIAEELIMYKFTGKETLRNLNNIFRAIMKKYNISQTTPAYNDEGEQTGVLGNTFRWSLYKTLWLDSIKRWLDLCDLFDMGEK